MRRNEIYQDLTVIITSSCIKSHPSTELLDKTVESLLHVHGLDDCDKIIVCDGYNVISDVEKEAFKTSEVHQRTADKYLEFIEKIKTKCTDGVYHYARVHVQPKNVGFAQNINTALEHYVTTEFVMIIQHDQLFIRDLDLIPLVECMKRNDGINYIGFCADSSKNEVNCRLAGVHFRKFYAELEEEINQYIRENCDSGDATTNQYACAYRPATCGNRSSSVATTSGVSFDLDSNGSAEVSILDQILYHETLPLKNLLLTNDENTTIATTVTSAHYPIVAAATDCRDQDQDQDRDQDQDSGQSMSDRSVIQHASPTIRFRKDTTRDRSLVTHIVLNYYKLRFGLPLMPLVFWYDKTHIARSDFYRHHVLNNCEKNKYTEYATGAPAPGVPASESRAIHTSTLELHSLDSQTGALTRKPQAIRGFIEDTFGVVHKSNISLYGLTYFYLYCGSYVYYDQFLSCSIQHANGRSFITTEVRREKQRQTAKG